LRIGIVLRVADLNRSAKKHAMDDSPEMLHQLGAFEPIEAKRVLPLLEAHQIPFEVERDDSALGQPNRALQFYFGMYPEGSKLAVFVRESDLPRALKALEHLFPT
jgi:hypothetical protein